MKNRTYKSLGIGALALALSIGSIFAVGCGGKRSEQYRQQGDVYFRLEKFADAAAEYNRALRADRENVLAQLGLARCLWAQRKHDEATAAYQAAIELKPDFSESYIEAARLMLEMGKADEAEALAQACEEIDPEKGGLLYAVVLQEKREHDKALAKFLTLREQFPESVSVRMRLGLAYLTADQPGEAERELKSILEEIDEQSLPARMALIDVYQAQGKLDETVQQFEELVHQHPDDVNLKLLLARSLLYSNRIEEAEAIARPIVEEIPDSGWANFVVGCCLIEREAYGEAILFLQAAAQSLQQHPVVAEKLALARSGGKLPQETTLRPQARPERGQAASESGRAENWRQLWREAKMRQLLENREIYLAESGADLREMLVLAALIRQDISLAEDLAVDLAGEAPMAVLLKALTTRDAQTFRNLSEQWEERDTPRQQLREYAMGFALGSVGMRGQALSRLSISLSQWPDNVIPLYILGRMYQTAQMPEFAARCMEKLLDRYPDNFEVRGLLSATLLDAGLIEEARQWAESTYTLSPNKQESIVNLALAYLRAREPELAVATLRHGRQALPEDRMIQIVLAEALLRGGDPEAARELLEDTGVPQERDAYRCELAALAAANLDDWETVQANLGDVKGRRPTSMAACLQLAALLRTGHATESPACLTALSSLTGNRSLGFPLLLAASGQPADLHKDDEAIVEALSADPEALSDLAYGLACSEAGVHETAWMAFQRVHDAVGGSPTLVTLILESFAADPPVEDNVEQAENLVGKYDGVPGAWLGLAQVYAAASDTSKQRQALDRALKTAPEDPLVLSRQARFAEEQADDALAMETYQRLLKLMPEDPTINNNLAYRLLEKGEDTAQALVCARRAHAKLPTHPGVLHTLGLAQLENGMMKDGLTNLALALELQPGNPTMLLDYGRALLANDMAEEGRRHLRLALIYADQLGLDFPRRTQAEALLAE